MLTAPAPLSPETLAEVRKALKTANVTTIHEVWADAAAVLVEALPALLSALDSQAAALEVALEELESEGQHRVSGAEGCTGCAAVRAIRDARQEKP